MVLSNWMSACNRMQVDPYLITLHKTQIQGNQRPQQKTRYTESERRGSEKDLELIGTGGYFLDRTPVAHIGSTIEKWDFMSL